LEPLVGNAPGLQSLAEPILEVVNAVYALIAVPTVTESPVVTVTLSPVVNDVYALIAVPTVTESPVVTLPSEIVNIPEL